MKEQRQNLIEKLEYIILCAEKAIKQEKQLMEKLGPWYLKQQLSDIERSVNTSRKILKCNKSSFIYWNSVDFGIPKLKTVKLEGGNYGIQNSKECIVFDGSDVFTDSFTRDEGFHESITHFIMIDEIRKPD